MASQVYFASHFIILPFKVRHNKGTGATALSDTWLATNCLLRFASANCSNLISFSFVVLCIGHIIYVHHISGGVKESTVRFLNFLGLKPDLSSLLPSIGKSDMVIIKVLCRWKCLWKLQQMNPKSENKTVLKVQYYVNRIKNRSWQKYTVISQSGIILWAVVAIVSSFHIRDDEERC